MQMSNSRKTSSFCFDDKELGRAWQTLVVMLLREALMNSESAVQEIIDAVAHEFWMPADVRRLYGKKHFLFYAGRYVSRPPIASRRIIALENGRVRFWYKDKRRQTTETLTYSDEKFIDRWARQLPLRYQHGVRYFGLFASRSWGLIAGVVFALLGEKPRRYANRRSWAADIQQQFGRNPLVDTKGELMKFVSHLSPVI